MLRITDFRLPSLYLATIEGFYPTKPLPSNDRRIFTEPFIDEA
jgi:hypothetical protein